MTEHAINPVLYHPAETTPRLSFDDAPLWLTEEVQERLHRLAVCHSGAGLMWKKGAIGAVMCGIELHHIKRLVGHGRFLHVMQEWCGRIGISERTGYRYMELAESARRALAKAGSAEVDQARLLGSGPATEDEFRQVLDALSSTTTGKDWADLLTEHQLTRGSVRGGFHPPKELLEKFARQHKLDAASYQEWPDEVKEQFRAWAKEQKRKAAAEDPQRKEQKRRDAAVKLWTPIMEQCMEAFKTKDPSWAALPASGRRTLRDYLRRLADSIDKSL